MELARKQDTAPAYELLAALSADIPGYVDWEPEALFEELDDGGVSTTALLQDKLMAAIAVKHTDEFYLSPQVFENTCTAFGNAVVLVDVVQEPEVRHMAWAMYEVNKLREDTDKSLKEPTEEIAKFVAVVLHRAGLVVAPDLLKFAQEHLDDLNHNAALATAVRKQWSKVQMSKLSSASVEEDPVGVQISRLLEVALYIKARKTPR